MNPFSTINRYILRSCLFYTIIILFAFVSIFSVFNILGELSDVGKGSFNVFAMLFYITALVPNFSYLLMPLAVLIGVMLALLGLVNHSEYAIIRTSGVSLIAIARVLLLFGIIFSILTFLLGELIAPKANHFAKLYKANHTKQMMSTELRSGIWSKDNNNTFVNIKQIMPDDTVLGVSVFTYDDNFRLLSFLKANTGVFDKNKQAWLLQDSTLYDYTNSRQITSKHFDSYLWQTAIRPAYFNVLAIAPEDMSAINLLRYIKHLNSNHQATNRYQIAFWNKMLYPVACISMALIALGFIPNNRRNVNLSGKLFGGILLGLSFFFTTKIVGFMALLFNWNAILAATLPTTLLFIIGSYALAKKN